MQKCKSVCHMSVCSLFHGPTSETILMKLGMLRRLHPGRCMGTLFLGKAKKKATKAKTQQHGDYF